MTTFYFAWVGGDPIPAMSLNTTGNIWSGSAQTRGTVWGGSLSTAGDIIVPTSSGSATVYLTVSNLRDTTGLISGGVYAIKGTGIPGYTNLTFNGYDGGTLNQPCAFGEGVSLTLTEPGGTDQVTLEDISSLVPGTDYGIAGSGIPADTTFHFGGSHTVTISNPATATGVVVLTLTNPNGRNTITSIADQTGLISGFTYEVFARGLPAGAEATYTDANTLELLGEATKSGIGVPLAISKGKTYPDGGAFDPDLHAREDEEIFAIEISQEEGNFAALKIEIRNPRVGLLSAGRNLWCWLSFLSGSDVIPLFHGRLMGVPANLHEEVVTLQFVARPNDFQAQKVALAQTLKVRFWDPVWLSQGQDDPDTVLEARPQSWHIDRKTLEVTVSDHLVGEDGTLVLTADDHFYDGMEVSYGATPLRRVTVTGIVSWTQTGSGTVDLTQQMVDAFRGAGSPYFYPIISSFTGPGLFDSWPQPGAGIGAGWSMAASASIEDATSWIAPWLMPKGYLQPNYTDKTIIDAPGVWVAAAGPGGLAWKSTISHTDKIVASWEIWATPFVLSPYAINFVVEWTASRPRTETISFALDASVQPLLTDPGGTEVEAINLSSSLVGEPIDPGELLPIGDLRRNAYLNTDRGAQSIEYLIALARAKLLARARAVNIKVATTWNLGSDLSCRQNVQVLDDRLPDGVATGKVTGYVLTANGQTGEQSAVITIGCSVGYAELVTPVAGAPSYVDDYVAGGYQATVGETLDPGTGDVTYQSLDDLDVLDDDGLDLLNMTPDRVLTSITIEGGVNHQAFTTLGQFPGFKGQTGDIKPENLGTVGGGTWAQYVEGETPSTALARDPTIVTLKLVPIGSQSFETTYAPAVSMLAIPQTINTEAEAP